MMLTKSYARSIYKIDRVCHFLTHMQTGLAFRNDTWEADIPWLVRRRPTERLLAVAWRAERHSPAVAGSDSRISYIMLLGL